MTTLEMLEAIPDKVLADRVRQVAAHLDSATSSKPAIYAACELLVALAAESTNAAVFRSELKGMTYADQPIGDWRITFQKLDESGNPLETDED